MVRRDWESLDFPNKDNLLILQRICTRGRNYFLDKQDSRGVDMFEHMENEVEQLALDLIKRNQ